MGHQPRSVMEQLQAARRRRQRARTINLIGEGWNFGEVQDGARFVQASQLSLNGCGIGTFSDRAATRVRGGGPFDGGDDLVSEPGLHQRPVLRRQRQLATAASRRPT